MDQWQEKVQRIQEDAYKDNIEISNMMKNMKRSVGLIYGPEYETRT
jgi:hypothetical protein